MTLCGLLCDADDWNSIAHYAREKENWFRQYLTLPNGIPSHDTFNRLFSLLAPEQFHDLFIDWVREILLTDCEVQGVIAVDGKSQRGSRVSANEVTHTVNAWSTQHGVCLGQTKVDDKSNEIAAVPKLLKKLAIKGCLVTADAMSCQKKIAKQIIAQEADYLLSVKNNQKTLYQAIDQHFTAYWDEHPEDQPGDEGFSRILPPEIAHERRFDGCYIITTDVPPDEMKTLEVVRAYKKLGLVEQAFRQMKTVQLEMRPVYHRKDDRIRAHVFLCVLAYYLQWHVMQRLTPLFESDGLGENRRWTLANVIETLKQITCNTLEADGVQFQQNSELTEEQARIVELLEVKV